MKSTQSRYSKLTCFEVQFIKSYRTSFKIELKTTVFTPVSAGPSPYSLRVHPIFKIPFFCLRSCLTEDLSSALPAPLAWSLAFLTAQSGLYRSSLTLCSHLPTSSSCILFYKVQVHSHKPNWASGNQSRCTGPCFLLRGPITL